LFSTRDNVLNFVANGQRKSLNEASFAVEKYLRQADASALLSVDKLFISVDIPRCPKARLHIAVSDLLSTPGIYKAFL
jgi:hypothetical protein